MDFACYVDVWMEALGGYQRVMHSRVEMVRRTLSLVVFDYYVEAAILGDGNPSFVEVDYYPLQLQSIVALTFDRSVSSPGTVNYMRLQSVQPLAVLLKELRKTELLQQLEMAQGSAWNRMLVDCLGFLLAEPPALEDEYAVYNPTTNQIVLAPLGELAARVKISASGKRSLAGQQIEYV